MGTDGASALLGQEVVVTLDRGSDEAPAVVARGTLLAWDEGGQVVLRDDMGFVHYCWPMLDVAAAVDPLTTADDR